MNVRIAVLAALCAASTVARADPRLDEKVYDPYVDNRTLEFESRVAREAGGNLAGANATVLEAEYGVSEHLSLAVVADIAGQPGSGDRLRGIGVEAVADLGHLPRTGVDVGVYLEYAGGLAGQTDSVEAKLLLAKSQGRFGPSPISLSSVRSARQGAKGLAPMAMRFPRPGERSDSYA